MRYKINDRTVRNLPVPAKGNKLYYDETDHGFAVRITSGGVCAFVVNYAIRGRERRITIGNYPAWSVEAARMQARALRRQIDDGRDPLEKREKDRAAPTVNGLCDRYLAEHAETRKRPRSAHEDRRMIDRFVRPRIGSRKADTIRFDDIDRLHREVTSESGPVYANRLHALLSKMFSLAVRWRIVAENPCKGVERNRENKRKRYLSVKELETLAAVLDAYPGNDEHSARRRQSCNVIRLLLLTGARKGEALRATWDQFDLAAGRWVKPGAETKQKTDHEVPLSRPAVELLAEIRAEGRESPYVFPMGDGYQRDIKNAWAEIRTRAGIADVRVHDLRHSYASQLASAGLGLPVIGRLLGHTQAATTARYAHLSDDPLREATERVGVMFKAAVGGKRGDVVALPTKAAS